MPIKTARRLHKTPALLPRRRSNRPFPQQSLRLRSLTEISLEVRRPLYPGFSDIDKDVPGTPLSMSARSVSFSAELNFKLYQQTERRVCFDASAKRRLKVPTLRLFFAITEIMEGDLSECEIIKDSGSCVCVCWGSSCIGGRSAAKDNGMSQLLIEATNQ